jgi:hypothetical protein
MNRILLALLAIFVFHASSSAAERIKIGYPDASGTFLSLQKLGFAVIARARELFSYPSSGLIVNAKRIKERPDEIKRMIKAGIDSFPTNQKQCDKGGPKNEFL